MIGGGGDLALTKMFCGPYMHGTYDEVGTTKHNWSARCQFNVTGRVSMWACDGLSQ